MSEKYNLDTIKDTPGQSGSSPLHISGVEHVTGRSQFVDDMPKPRNLLAVKLLASPVANGEITELNVDSARAVPGVCAVLTSKDIPGWNQIGAILPDETCLAEGHVHYVGEPVAIVAAETAEIAEAALKKIVLRIEEHPPVLTVSQALEKGQFVGPIRKIERGDVDSVFASAKNVMEGVVHNGGQEHFYLETQRALCVPEEDGCVTIYSSTQNPSEVHRMASNVLGMPQNRITIDVKRLGGGFGGKEAQATAWACIPALVACHTGRPAELVLEREEDMQFTGKRHVYESRYKVAFDDTGKVLAYHVELQSNCGAVADVSTSVLERSMLHADNSYFIPNMRVIGRPCRTNIHPATAFRGFGAPQGILAVETVLERIARKLGLDPVDVKERNLYRRGEEAHYGQEIIDADRLGLIFGKLRKDCDWAGRRKRNAEFNAASKYLKKGLGVVPVKFGISFTAAHLNQGQALVHVFYDGSVSVTHGAIEMGQEVNTKIAQIAATTLGVPFSNVRVESNNTKRVANSPPTAASSGCDLNGHAVENAALQIAGRLRDFAKATFKTEDVVIENGRVFAASAPEKLLCSFKELSQKAFVARIDLSAHGFYASPGIYFSREEGKGHPFLYYVFGAAAVEVTVDLLTGHCSTDYVHIVHDNGRSLNPVVDIGQLHGGFLQGLGWATMEELVYDDKGRLLSNSPATYKIPSYGDAPAEMRVELLANSDNSIGVHRSKANGEPPFIYGEAVLFAVADAIAAAGSYPEALSIPATPEKVLEQLRLTARKSGKTPVAS